MVGRWLHGRYTLRPMRNGALTGARAALLAGPVALAFFSGGFFDGPRVWAGLAAWALVLVAALLARRPLPRSGPARLAVGALALFAAWTLASAAWAPEAGPAYHDGQRVILYAGGLLAAVSLLRGRATLRAVEPAVAAGATIVVGYGISERLLPWLLQFHRDLSAFGRLDEPLTYWNAMGEVAALGLVLCARLSADRTRAGGVRAAAAAAAAPLGMGLYLSISRGALFACAAGLVTLVVLAPSRATVRGLAITLGAGALAVAASAPFAAVTSLQGSSSTRTTQGTVSLVALLAIMAAATLGQRAVSERERAGQLGDEPLPLPRHAAAIALAIVVAGFVLFLAVGAKERSGTPVPATASRLSSLQSNRYAYWRVAWRAFEAQPLRGVGAGGWAVYWLRYRPFNEGAQDAHSLYIQTAAELGIVGLALLAAFLAGLVWAARVAYRLSPALAAGPIAAVVVWAAHCAVDWDWEMPAVTLTALLAAAVLLSLAELRSEALARAKAPRSRRARRRLAVGAARA